MSRDQANAFKKQRDADDPQGDLTWVARLGHKALRAAPEALARLDVESEFELGEAERVLWRLLKLPRKYVDLEYTGVLPIELCRAFFRGLVAADVVDIVDANEAKALLPAEVKRLKAEVAGKEVSRSTQPLKARVYRPDIDGNTAPPALSEPMPSSPPRTQTPAPSHTSMPRTPAPHAEMDGEQRMLKDEIERAFLAMARQNHFEFMGLVRGANDGDVRAAYMRLAREYHPDRVASGAFAADPSIRVKVDALFKRLGDAHEMLTTAESRGTYERTLDALGAGGGAPAAPGKKQRRPLEANNAFKMAETYFKRREMKQAEAHYRQASTFDGEDPKILTGLAWCIYQNTDQDEAARTADARKRLTEIVGTYKFGDAAYKLGLMLRKANDEAAAQRQFALAHKFDPAHVEASREMRLADSRQQKAKDDKASANSLLGRLGLKK